MSPLVSDGTNIQQQRRQSRRSFSLNEARSGFYPVSDTIEVCLQNTLLVQ